jgi:hypothetical protein
MSRRARQVLRVVLSPSVRVLLYRVCVVQLRQKNDKEGELVSLCELGHALGVMLFLLKQKSAFAQALVLASRCILFRCNAGCRPLLLGYFSVRRVTVSQSMKARWIHWHCPSTTVCVTRRKNCNDHSQMSLSLRFFSLDTLFL